MTSQGRTAEVPETVDMVDRPVRPTRIPRRFSVIGVLGELLITAGVFVFLFLGWQLWLNDLIVGASQRDEALELSQQFAPQTPAPTSEPVDPTTPIDYGEPVVAAAPTKADKFANIFVPRFGADFVRTIAQGVDQSPMLADGVGHYPDTQMPGEVGNFAVAGHRTTHGAPFNQISELRVGDPIYVQTADGWYTYRFRSLEYVRPTSVDVLLPVPRAPGIDAVDRMITLTSCNPLLSAAERIIAYGVFESWQPASAGPPADIAALATGGA
ncbi:MAG: hypothetical protein RI885_2505 [Actinomycetota bacterium]|jgi:sortase A